ncbi:hypothetical protein H0V99_00955 [Candidatus Saccharibacteria bacterium]|nr:hypothetical protein [Candidatus Saccharibacteria bacterium]
MNEQVPEIIDRVPTTAELQGKEQVLITSVPGMEQIVSVEPVETEAPLGSRQNPVVVKGANFRGDPRKVPGHPSNPTSDMSEAFGEYLDKRE